METEKTMLFKKNFENNIEHERFTQDGNPTTLIPEIRTVPQPQEKSIKDVDQKNISRALSIVLANTYILYLKTQNFHWNVTGSNFLTLHTLFMNQYNDLALANDILAERIRALNQPAPGSFLEFTEIATIKEEKGVQKAEKMIETLHADQIILIQSIRNIIPIAENCLDFTTVDLLTQRLQVHEKNAWMLSSFLK